MSVSVRGQGRTCPAFVRLCLGYWDTHQAIQTRPLPAPMACFSVRFVTALVNAFCFASADAPDILVKAQAIQAKEAALIEKMDRGETLFSLLGLGESLNRLGLKIPE